MLRPIGVFFGILLSIILVAPFGSTEDGPRTPAQKTGKAPYVVVLLIDGARSDIMHDLAAQGKLPNIQKLFLDEGLDVKQGVTVFPTTSTNAYQSFMTGLFPGHAGIPYLARYSRSEKESIEYLSLKGIKIMNADLLNWYQLNDPDIPYQVTQGSLFDHLSDLGTASIYSTFRRGAGLQTPSFPLRAAWNTFVLHDHEMLDVLAYRKLKRLYEGPQDKIPHFTFVAFLAIDVLAHQDGARAPRFLHHFVSLDKMIGDFWKQVENRGLADRTYLVLVGDHGNHDISERSYLRERLIKEGIAIRSRHMRPPYELAINARGVSAAIIAVAGEKGWKSYPTLEDLRRVPIHRNKQPHSGGEGEAPTALPVEGATQAPKIDLIDYLRHQPETDLLLVRNGNHQVRIFNQDSESEVTRVWSGGHYWYSYRTLNGHDPLKYSDDPHLRTLILNQTPLTAAQWLPLTAHKEYGDAIVQIAQIFTDGRAGDMMIVPKHDWVFRHEKANTHGGLSQEDIHIPIMMRGPGIAPQKIAYARSVDVMPTILAWFGKTTPHRDGQNLLAPDPLPSRAESELAQHEVRILNHPLPLGGGLGRGGHALGNSSILQKELTLRQDRVNKLTTLTERCTQRRPKPEDRLTRPDRAKKIRISTCEVVDLAAKSAYEDLERLLALREAPQTTAQTARKGRHAAHNTIQHNQLDGPRQ